MKILVSNDDGYRAEGIARLRAALGRPGRRDGGGAGPQSQRRQQFADARRAAARVRSPSRACYYVHRHAHRLRAPGDLRPVRFRVRHGRVSGINDGPNLGDDVLYSGTVAAAIEGRFLGLPTMAVSLCTSAESRRHFDTGARVARELVAGLLRRPLDPTLMLNVNVPDLPYEQLRGIRRDAARHPPPLRAGAAGTRSAAASTCTGSARRAASQDAGEGTDFHAVAAGLGVGHAAVDRPDAPCGAAGARQLARRRCA